MHCMRHNYSYLNMYKFSDILNLAILAYLVFSLKLAHAKPTKCMAS